ncbi:MAG: AAA family ATPase [Anaerolineaceae bacterium]|nr:AAA family ATPase [Anaerolineaceae bacterium]
MPLLQKNIVCGLIMFSWLKNFRIDHLSFWLGFVAAGIFWWLYKKTKVYIPKLKELKDQGLEITRQHQLTADEIYYSLNVLEIAQNKHLAGAFFPLETIIIPPILLPPPLDFDPDRDIPENLATASITSQVLPYLPDWPELNAQYPVPTLTPAEALQKGSRIILIGNPGAGKTTALAYLASQIANRDESVGVLANLMPVFLHILDINVPTEISEKDDPVEILLDAIILQNPGRNARSLRKHLKSAITEHKAILLLDGLDELNQEEHHRAVSYLKKLFDTQNKIRIITTGSTQYVGGLIQIGFYPLTLKPWSAIEIEQFVEKWDSAWYTTLAPEQPDPSSQSFLLKNWIKNFKMVFSPLEWSLLIWGIYAGDIHGLSAMNALEAYIGRISTRSAPRLALESLAKELLLRKQTFISYGQANRFLSKFNPDQAVIAASADAEYQTSEIDSSENHHLRQRKQKVSSSERAISDLLESGVLSEHAQNNLRFSHPLIAGYLASFAITTPKTEFQKDEYWELNKETLHFLAVQDKTALWHKQALSQEADLLFTNVLRTARWLRDTPPELHWRTQTLKYLLGLIHSQSIPFAVRARFTAAFVVSNDSSVPLLFEKLLENGTTDVRWLAALGAGAIRDVNAVPTLRKLFADPDPNVRKAA